ncbi:alpha/beta fold hydrolase [Streptomyces massasporeus]|uniref:alpha/beta fold hydrolase n=1 Tax=Streptomyces massasporeus TaxID=67324 RepID=UPI00382D4022
MTTDARAFCRRQSGPGSRAPFAYRARHGHSTEQANGITQAHRVWGPRNAQPLVLLHARGDTTDAQRNAPNPVWCEHMGRITMPVLLIGGGLSSPMPREQIAAFADLLPDARHITLDAGHLVHETRPEEYLAAVAEFLSPAARTPS